MLVGLQTKENMLDSFLNLIPDEIPYRIFDNTDGCYVLNIYTLIC